MPLLGLRSRDELGETNYLRRTSKDSWGEELFSAMRDQKHSSNRSVGERWTSSGNESAMIDPRQLVFVVRNPTSRVAKIGSALTEAGWEVILIHLETPLFNLQKHFTKALPALNVPHAAYLASSFRPLVFHVFDSWNLDLARMFLSLRPGPIVLDIYDALSGTAKPGTVRACDAINERLCLEGYNGLCARGLMHQIAKRELGYKLPENILFFPDLCRSKEVSFLPKRTDGLHLAYVGTVPVQFRYDRHQLGCCDMDFIRAMAAKGIHLHYYPFSAYEYENHYRPYLEFAELCPFFHFYRPLPHEELLREISQFHLGFLSISEKTATHGDWTFNAKALDLFIPNKIFDYLDANLGIILHSGRIVNWFMSRTGTTLLRTREALLQETKETLLAFARRGDLQANINKTRQQFSLARQLYRLEQFYHRVRESFQAHTAFCANEGNEYPHCLDATVHSSESAILTP